MNTELPSQPHIGAPFCRRESVRASSGPDKGAQRIGYNSTRQEAAAAAHSRHQGMAPGRRTARAPHTAQRAMKVLHEGVEEGAG